MRNIFSDFARFRSNDRNGACVRIDASNIYSCAYLKSLAIKLMLVVGMMVVGLGLRGETVTIDVTTSGVTGSYQSTTFTQGGFTFGYNQWMKSTNIQAKKSTTNSLYNATAFPGKILNITFKQTGTARAITVYGGTSSQPTNQITSPATSQTMTFDFSDHNYTYFSMTTPGNACYFDEIIITYESIPIVPYTVEFDYGTGSSSTTPATTELTEASAGAGIRLPSATPPAGCDPEYTFYGWATAPVSATTNAPSIVGTTGNTYHPSEDNITLYAVYKQTNSGNVEKTYGWESADDGTFWEITNMDNTNSSISAHSGSKYGNTAGRGTAYIKTANKIAHPTSIKCYYSKVSNNTNSSSKFSIKVSSDGDSWTEVAVGNTFNNVTQGTWYELSADLSSYENYYIEVYYSGTTAVRALDDVKLVYNGGVNTYNTNPSCTPPTTATLTYNANGGSGSMESQTVDIGNSVTVAANGFTAPDANHFVKWNTAANGSGTDYLPGDSFNLSVNTTLYAIWEINSYAVTWYVNGASVQSRNYDHGTTITGVPDDPTSVECDGKVFVGWTTAEVVETDEAPTLLSGDDIEGITVTAELTYYAVFAVSSVGGAAEWQLVTDASTLAVGDVLVIASNTEGKVAGNISDQLMSEIESTFSADLSSITSLGSGAIQLTLGGSAGDWTLSNSDNLLGATAVKKLAWGSGTTIWSISIADGDATIQNGTASYGRFLYNVNSPRFTTYTSDATSSMLLPQLYRNSGGVTYSAYSTSCVPCEADPVVSSDALVASNITTTTATISCAGITFIGGAHCNISSYGFVYGTTTNPTISDNIAIVGTSYSVLNTAFQKTIEDLDPCTTYHVRAYATNGHGTAYGPDLSFVTANNAAITSLTTSCMKNTAATVNVAYTSCTSNSDIFAIAIRKGANPPASLGTTEPANITGNPAFGSGYQFGEADLYSYVIYKGTTMPSTVDVTGLEPGASYKLKAYRWIAEENKWTTNGNPMTLNLPKVTSLLADNTETSEVLTWNISGTVCSGGHYVVICREGSDDITSTCSDFTSITANANLGSGTQTQTGEYAVYSGSDPTASITGLTAGTTYTAAVFYVDDEGNCSQPTQVSFTYSTTTILEPGDLAILAINNTINPGVNSGDEFTFMIFKNITPGTTIDMTDNGYERNYEGYWGTEEGAFRITRKNSSLSAGSVITLTEKAGRINNPTLGDDGNIDIYVNGSEDNANWEISWQGVGSDHFSEYDVAPAFDLNNTDQIWIMQGGSWNYIEKNKAEYTGNVLYGYTATGWKPIYGYCENRGSTIYPGCDCFVSTLNIDSGIAKYTGLFTEVTKREWIMRINDEDNWTAYSNSNYSSSGPNYKDRSGGPESGASYPLPIASGDFTQGKWSGKKSSDWCDCANWMSLVVPDENVDVEIPDVGSNYEVEIYTGDTAKCKTLTITDDGRFRNTQNNSTLKVVGDITIDAGGTFVPTDDNAFEIITGGNIVNNGTFITKETTSLKLTSASSQSISARSGNGNMKLRNLTMASTANNFGSDTVELYGNLKDNSSTHTGFDLPQSLAFKGERVQSSTATAITDITMNKSANDLSLSGMLTVNGNGKFVMGDIVGDVTFTADATTEGASAASYVDGTVTKKANASAFSFPTGSNGVLGKLDVSGLGADTDLKFNHDPDGFSTSEMPVWWNQNNMCPANGTNAKFDHVSNMYFWNLGSSSPMEDAIFTVTADEDIHFNDATVEREESDIAMAIYDGCWKNLGGTTTTNATSYSYISVSDVDLPATRAAGDKIVTLGSIDHNTLLPIELVSFAAECKDGDTKIMWTTASEHSNDYFVLERSYDAINFAEVARVAGVGNSISQTSYSHTVYGGGSAYYRLVQVDYDGTSTVSEIIVAECSSEYDGDLDVKAYPNPFAGDLTLRFENFGGRIALVEVYDMLGRMLVSRKVVCSQNDYEFVLPLGGLPDGAYNVRVSAEDVVINRQVVKNR